MQTISKYATRSEANHTSDTPPPPHQQTYSITHYPSQSGLVQNPQEQYGLSQNAAPTPHYLQLLHQLNQLQAIIPTFRKTTPSLVYLV
ncbi:unnamed protein product [Acanthoscelides obtectus]|uniref:Uncharacterized protein n=1 Tax=Acanthoscelides obtectus TaxID=200917 RepID=A0A9P0LKD2_ACAOB|nr:unnamed protein product [Acanthoscelides obtectus]CAK1651456.1 hypothetical protein AOBTE_LOCUS17291 [Acanthoscelides obtectus]